MSDAWRSIIEALQRPRYFAAAVAVGLAALLGGTLLSVAIMAGPRGAGRSEPSVPVAVPTRANPTEVPSLKEAPTTSAPAATTDSAPTSAPSATSAATPAPPCCPGSDWDITGAWRALPPMPNSATWEVSDVIVLDSGALIAIRWPSTNERSPHIDQVVAWSIGASEWVQVSAGPFVSGTDFQFAQGADGLIYSYENTLDPTTAPWTTAPFKLADPSEPYAGIGLDAGPDGRIYRPATWSRGGIELEIYDPTTGARDTSSRLPGPRLDCVLRGGDAVHLVGLVGIASYRPDTDTWTERVATPGDRDCNGAGFGPDGRLYLAAMWSAQDIVAWDAELRRWLTVEPPEAGPHFRPRFVTGPDGRLWAIDPEQSFVFTPGGE